MISFGKGVKFATVRKLPHPKPYSEGGGQETKRGVE